MIIELVCHAHVRKASQEAVVAWMCSVVQCLNEVQLCMPCTTSAYKLGSGNNKSFPVLSLPSRRYLMSLDSFRVDQGLGHQTEKVDLGKFEVRGGMALLEVLN